MKKYLLIAVLFLTFSLQAQKVKKIEPPFWWTNMNHNQLELLIYGDDIASYKPSIENKNIIITGVKKTENSHYLFLDLDISKAQVGTFKINFSKKGKKNNFSVNYKLKQRSKNSKFRKGFNSSDVVYLLMPDRFANGDVTNDSSKYTFEKANRKLKGGRHGGDIQGIINHLDYIKQLGATAIWSTPLLEDNQSVYSYHGYAITNPYKIDPRYGTNELYKNLVEKAHKKGIKLIMDYVTNHWGSNNWIIKDLPTYSWIHQFPNFQRSNYRMSTQFDSHASKIDAKLCMDGWFDKTMPDLNQSNPLVLKYLIQNAIWWIEYANLDGLRVDTYSYNNKEGIAKWTKAIMDEYPNFNIVGEVWMHNQAAISYWQKDSKIGAIESYNSYLPSVMDFTLHDAITAMFNQENTSWDNGMIKAYNNFANDYLYPNSNNMLVFAENHDTQRINEIFNGDINKYKLAITLIATVRGIPQLYYGSEIGMRGNKNNGDGAIRKDFPGGWQKDTNDAFTNLGRTTKQNEYFNFTSKLLNWRKTSEVIHTGKTTHYIPENNVYVYFRYNEKKSVMIVINNNPKEQTIPLNRFAENLKKYTSGIDILTDTKLDLSKSDLTISGKTALVIELKK
ncbi:glycoside hydrolase family 13 protein [Lutibacter sp.]|uniref:glycoside hydrolase family 13 protein n=1 Tax=Lutibacter sp. TaxID=1925666 RepID=UPI0025B805FC|nr:glycoside hydrolase family 13 protein [Lutibacter sp.]MCF6182021.1 glycoside hydrolase family 13 protein [Lutibacter sp.]